MPPPPLPKSAKKPSVLVLGGVGFIGRNFVKYLVDNKLCSAIKVADKKQPMVSYFHPDHKAAFDSKLVTYKQTDLSRTHMVERLFVDKKKNIDVRFDYVVNLCGETRPKLTQADYKQKCLTAATTTAEVAKKYNVKKWIEVSDAYIYAADKTKSNEDSKTDGCWTVQSEFRLQAEDALRKMNIPMVVLRPAIVYGPGDMLGLTPRIACAAAYKRAKEKLKFLWTADHRINTVHVNDVCKAIWHACTKLQTGTIYNLADSSDFKAGDLNKILGKLFAVKTGFWGGIFSRAAMVNLKGTCNMANEKHTPMWRAVCADKKILNTPVDTYIGSSLLKNKHLSVDGTKITTTGFTYDVPECNEATVRAAVQFLIDQNIFPDTMQPASA